MSPFSSPLGVMRQLPSQVTSLQEDKLTEEEKFRNSNRLELLYVGPSHGLMPFVMELQDICGSLPEDQRVEHKQELDPEASGGMAGYIALGSGNPLPSVMTAPFGLGDDITANGVACVTYINPDRQPHLPKLQEGTVLPRPCIEEKDLPPKKELWCAPLVQCLVAAMGWSCQRLLAALGFWNGLVGVMVCGMRGHDD